MQNEDEFNDWNAPEDDIPSGLSKKWDRADNAPEKKIVCRSCGQEVAEGSLLCLWCGGSTGQRAGLFSTLRYWMSESIVGVAVFFLFLLAVLLLFSFY